MAADSRKRALEALERRIVVAKAEVVQKEKKNKKAIIEAAKSPVVAVSTSNDSSLHLRCPSSETHKKGNSTSYCLGFCYFLLQSQ